MEQLARTPTLCDRLAARFLARRLDRALAAGAAPESSPALALRARRLTGYSSRLSIAKSLRTVVRASRDGSRSYVRAVPQGPVIRAARDELSELADALTRPGPVCPRGVAQTWILLADGTGPLHDGRRPRRLSADIAVALENLRPIPPP